MRSKRMSKNSPPLRRNRWGRLILALLPAICATTGGLGTSGCTPRTLVKTDFCTGWKPIYPSRQDVLTDGTAKQILAHDEQGVQQGCWPAPRKPGPK